MSFRMVGEMIGGGRIINYIIQERTKWCPEGDTLWSERVDCMVNYLLMIKISCDSLLLVIPASSLFLPTLVSPLPIE